MIDLQLEIQLNQDKTGTATIIMARAKSCNEEIMKQANHPEKDLGAVVWAILDSSQICRQGLASSGYYCSLCQGRTISLHRP